MNMDILAALPGFILTFILIFCYEYRIKLIKNKPRNRVHFKNKPRNRVHFYMIFDKILQEVPFL